MLKELVVISGKGGTGKTSVLASFGPGRRQGVPRRHAADRREPLRPQATNTREHTAAVSLSREVVFFVI